MPRFMSDFWRAEINRTTWRKDHITSPEQVKLSFVDAESPRFDGQPEGKPKQCKRHELPCKFREPSAITALWANCVQMTMASRSKGLWIDMP